MSNIDPSSSEKPIVILTGASGGIGRAIFEDLAQDHFVVGTSTSEEGADLLRQFLAEKSFDGAGSVLDLSDPANVEPWYKAVKDQFGIPSVLVNNAGITEDNVMMTKTPPKLDRIMTTNFSSPYELMRLTAMGMRKKGGAILNISSVVAYIGNPGQTAYAASKAAMDASMRWMAEDASAGAAMDAVTRSASAEYKGSPRINSLALGAVDTSMFRAAPQEFQDAIIGATEIRRAFSTLEVAQAVRKILGSDINGQVVHMNSGLFDPKGVNGHVLLTDLK